MIPACELRKLVELDPATGKMTWKHRDASYFKDSGGRYTQDRAARVWNTRYAGKPAFDAPHRMGYLTGTLFYKDLLAHRVVWALVYGEWPSNTIDHINGVKTDNRPENLRDVKHIDNMRNQKARSNNTSGATGIFHRKQNAKYDAFIHVNGKKKHVGTFDELNDAVLARGKAASENGFHENHGGKR